MSSILAVSCRFGGCKRCNSMIFHVFQLYVGEGLGRANGRGPRLRAPLYRLDAEAAGRPQESLGRQLLHVFLVVFQCFSFIFIFLFLVSCYFLWFSSFSWSFPWFPLFFYGPSGALLACFAEARRGQGSAQRGETLKRLTGQAALLAAAVALEDGNGYVRATAVEVLQRQKPLDLLEIKEKLRRGDVDLDGGDNTITLYYKIYLHIYMHTYIYTYIYIYSIHRGNILVVYGDDLDEISSNMQKEVLFLFHGFSGDSGAPKAQDAEDVQS